jgi:hypothetical protein
MSRSKQTGCPNGRDCGVRHPIKSEKLPIRDRRKLAPDDGLEPDEPREEDELLDHWDWWFEYQSGGELLWDEYLGDEVE